VVNLGLYAIQAIMLLAVSASRVWLIMLGVNKRNKDLKIALKKQP
jgi:hypothetical protein